MNLRQPQLIITHNLFALLLLTFSSAVLAFPDYSGCEGCHGGFRDGGYVSKTDATPWNSDLMGGHEQFVTDCYACHNDSGFGEVFLNSSGNTQNTLKKGCVGCHGREEDVNNNCVGTGGVQVECGAGAGLRMLHEMNAPEANCSACHTGDPAPTGEQNNPSYYGQASVLVDNACNADGTENVYGLYGLDNDGDGQVDADDSDCQATAFEINPGLSGHWYGGPTHGGEGFLMDIAYNIFNQVIVVVSFYTYDTAGNQTWLIGPAAAEGDTVTIDLAMPEGGVWGDPVGRVETPWGTGTFTFTSCEVGHISLVPNADMQAEGFTNIEYDISRGGLLIPGIDCPIENP